MLGLHRHGVSYPTWRLQTPMDTTTQVEWLKKSEAAARLKMSTRTILAMAAAGKIRRKPERDPLTNQVLMLLHAGDIERIAYDREHPQAPQAVQRDESTALQTTSSTALSKTRQDATNPLSLMLAVLAKQALGPAPNAWMDLDTASAEYGLSRTTLIRLIHQKRLPAIQDEPIKTPGNAKAKAGSSWRVCRRDLDNLAGMLAVRGEEPAHHA